LVRLLGAPSAHSIATRIDSGLRSSIRTEWNHRAQQFLAILVGGRRRGQMAPMSAQRFVSLRERCLVEDDAFLDVALEQSFEALYVVLGEFPFLVDRRF
jgi:hypothetical protein